MYSRIHESHKWAWPGPLRRYWLKFIPVYCCHCCCISMYLANCKNIHLFCVFRRKACSRLGFKRHCRVGRKLILPPCTASVRIKEAWHIDFTQLRYDSRRQQMAFFVACRLLIQQIFTLRVTWQLPDACCGEADCLDRDTVDHPKLSGVSCLLCCKQRPECWGR